MLRVLKQYSFKFFIALGICICGYFINKCNYLSGKTSLPPKLVRLHKKIDILGEFLGLYQKPFPQNTSALKRILPVGIESLLKDELENNYIEDFEKYAINKYSYYEPYMPGCQEKLLYHYSSIRKSAMIFACLDEKLVGYRREVNELIKQKQ